MILRGATGLDTKLEDTGDGIGIGKESRLRVVVIVCEDRNGTNEISDVGFIQRTVEVNSAKHFNDHTKCTRLSDMVNVIGVHREC